jgi:hypothetical protein
LRAMPTIDKATPVTIAASASLFPIVCLHCKVKGDQNNRRPKQPACRNRMRTCTNGNFSLLPSMLCMANTEKQGFWFQDGTFSRSWPFGVGSVTVVAQPPEQQPPQQGWPRRPRDGSARSAAPSQSRASEPHSHVQRAAAPGPAAIAASGQSVSTSSSATRATAASAGPPRRRSGPDV